MVWDDSSNIKGRAACRKDARKNRRLHQRDRLRVGRNPKNDPKGTRLYRINPLLSSFDDDESVTKLLTQTQKDRIAPQPWVGKKVN